MAAIEQKQGRHIERQQRGADGRVVTAYSTSDLYELVGDVARKAKPQAPETLSIREFDRALAAFGYADAPSGRAIYARMKRRPWPEIVEIALGSERNQDYAERVQERKAEAPWLSERHLFYALNRIAQFKGVTTMTEGDYDRSRSQFLDERSSWNALVLSEEQLPTASQIIRIAKTLSGTGRGWDKALAFAKLNPVGSDQRRALSVVAGIDIYIEATGGRYLPTLQEWERLGREFGIAFEKREISKPWTDYLREAHEARKQAGKAVPAEIAGAKTGKPTLVRPEGLAENETKTRFGRSRWLDNEEAMVEALLPYFRHCREHRVRPTQKGYMAFRKGDPAMPASSTLGRMTGKGWAEWVKIAEARLRAEKKAA